MLKKKQYLVNESLIPGGVVGVKLNNLAFPQRDHLHLLRGTNAGCSPCFPTFSVRYGMAIVRETST